MREVWSLRQSLPIISFLVCHHCTELEAKNVPERTEIIIMDEIYELPLYCKAIYNND